MLCVISLQDADERKQIADGFASLPDGRAEIALNCLAWLTALHTGLGHSPYLVVGSDDQTGELRGFLPLSFVQSALFGRYLVSLPYLNSGGVQVTSEPVSTALIDAAVDLADRLNVRYLELRHEVESSHPRLTHSRTSKVHMRLELPEATEVLWAKLNAKVRNQVRKAETHALTVHWGAHDLLDDFYRVFVRNMRDLGTPSYAKRLFQSILTEFPNTAEICVVRNDRAAIAAAMLVHERGTTQVPTASSLRSHNFTNANMLMYWRLLCRAIERRSAAFDFGRSTLESGTYRFKKQWGAQPFPSVWQYYTRQGDVDERRPENPRYRRAIAIWRRLPVALTRLLGPPIVRGIP